MRARGPVWKQTSIRRLDFQANNILGDFVSANDLPAKNHHAACLVRSLVLSLWGRSIRLRDEMRGQRSEAIDSIVQRNHWLFDTNLSYSRNHGVYQGDHLHFCEMHPHAHMNPAAETEMMARVTCYVEFVGIGEGAMIPVCRCKQHHHTRVRRYLGPGDIDRARCMARKGSDRRRHTDSFICRITSELRPL